MVSPTPGGKDAREGGGKAEWMIYAFVARGTAVLAEYTEFTGNFPAIAAQCLQRLPAGSSSAGTGPDGRGDAPARFSYACDRHTFNFLLYRGYAYCVVAEESVPKNVSVAFLERLKDDFMKRYGGGKADTALAKCLNKEYGQVIKQHIQYVLDHSEELDKMLKVQAQVSEVKNIMLDSIEKTLGRGEKLSELQDKTSELHIQAQQFKKQGVKIRRKTWLQNMKIKLVILGILLLLVIIVWVSICQGFDCTKHET
ncbi:vesicle-associated membrane protein 724 isoform X1 [Zea mays]|uniref:Vesicle-associated membrane protein 724 n=1 Tax=Zea mays TaxID=4577 RepID=A0A1D6HWP5_MAIZE|nr:vesicle-associated membrane protein 724 [Zea mays]XP_008651494.1 vesicle-associated membrane protein 724 isoform X1 [Zea mays]ONM52645.1 Vesicle-associated membrane protein 724 [Zea mays]ONM52646.1 Vesicle-associated membrane protein 724 [Zea mays]|eukprot:XP_008651494.1 vesicle-associated membrane protein 724 isoform X1 [Zea mays]